MIASPSVKPRIGMASEGFTLVRSAEDFPKTVTAEANMAEEFVEGEMIHVDGVILHGEPCLLSASKYVNGGCLAYREGKVWGSLMLSPGEDLFQKARTAAQEVIAALPSPSTSHGIPLCLWKGQSTSRCSRAPSRIAAITARSVNSRASGGRKGAA